MIHGSFMSLIKRLNGHKTFQRTVFELQAFESLRHKLHLVYIYLREFTCRICLDLRKSFYISANICARVCFYLLLLKIVFTIDCLTLEALTPRYCQCSITSRKSETASHRGNFR